jgi:ABC-type Zn uptake system ZnuABC Zn-binding protein ZnuA
MLCKMKKVIILITSFFLFSACLPAQTREKPQMPTKKYLAVESFLTDIAQNVAGNRLTIDSLIPRGMDPHTFEPTPSDLTLISDCQLIIMNGAGMESWLRKLIGNAGGHCQVVEASFGLVSRSDPLIDQSNPLELDPHFFMDPVLVIHYVENIRDAFTKLDPYGKQEYAHNAQAYIQQLKDLDTWIKSQVAQIPLEKRLIVTNHESLGYFADQYKFKVVGTILPSASSEAQPSAQQIAQLVEVIHQTGVKAIFLESGTNPDLAEHIAQDTGIKVFTNLYEHSLSDATGPASTYIDMMKYNTLSIVNALK